MRDYTGVSVADLEDQRVRAKLAVIDYYLRDLSRGLGLITKGLVPDGSGNTIINNSPLSDIYLVLLGRPGNQVAHGGTSPGGTLTLSSTTSTTRGKVYLGEARQSAYDETNEMLGMGLATPTARVHIKVPDGVPTYYSPFVGGDAVNGGWGLFGGASVHAVLNSLDDATSYLQYHNTANSLSDQASTTLTTPLPSGLTLAQINLRLWTYNSPTAGNTIKFALYRPADGLTYYSATYQQSAITTPFTWVDFSVVIDLSTGGVSAGAGDIKFIAASNGDDSYIFISYATVQSFVAPAVTLQKWQSDTASNALDYALDGNSNTSLTFTGTRMAVSASAFAITEGTPASGDVLTSQDSIGTVQWTAASALMSNHNLLSPTHLDTVSASPVLGDMIYANATPKWTKLAGVSATAKGFLNQIGDGTASGPPSWNPLASPDIPSPLIGKTYTVTDHVEWYNTSAPSVPFNSFSVYARASGSNIQLVGRSTTGAECIICTLADTTYVNELQFNDIAP